MARDDGESYDDEDEDLSDDEDDDEDAPDVGVTVEIVGLSLYTHHGVTVAEREVGQRLVLDVRFDVGEPDALITDRVEDTVDYGEVCQVIALIAQQRSYKTLERLCAAIADRLASQFGALSVTVKASTPEPPIPLPVEEVSVEVPCSPVWANSCCAALRTCSRRCSAVSRCLVAGPATLGIVSEYSLPDL